MTYGYILYFLLIVSKARLIYYIHLFFFSISELRKIKIKWIKKKVTMAAPPPSYAATTNDKGYPPYPHDPNMAYPPMQNAPYPTGSNVAYPPPAPQPVVTTYPPPSYENLTHEAKSTDGLYGIVSFDNKTVRLGESDFVCDLILNWVNVSRSFLGKKYN